MWNTFQVWPGIGYHRQTITCNWGELGGKGGRDEGERGAEDGGTRSEERKEKRRTRREERDVEDGLRKKMRGGKGRRGGEE